MAGSVAEEITRLSESLRLCRSAVKARGGSISATAGYSQLPEAIRSLPGDGSVVYDSYTDTDVSYFKTVPEGSLGHCSIRSVAGCCYTDTEILDNLIPYPYLGLKVPWGEIEIAEGTQPGSIDYTAVAPDSSVGTATFYLNTEDFYLYPGSYYFNGPNGNNYLAGRDTDGNAVSIFLSPGSFTVDKTVIINRILYEIYCSEGDTGTVYPIISEAQNTKWQPRWEGYRKAAITGIRVTGRNLIPFPYRGGGSGTVKSQNGITFTVQEDKGIKIEGKATAFCYFSLVIDDYGEGSIDATMKQSATNRDYSISKRLYYAGRGNGNLRVHVSEGETVNETIYPMCNSGSTLLDYEPYEERYVPMPTELISSEYWGLGKQQNRLYNVYNLENGSLSVAWLSETEQNTEQTVIPIKNGIDPIIKVKPGGRIVFENEYKLPVYSEIQYELYSD